MSLFNPTYIITSPSYAYKFLRGWTRDEVDLTYANSAYLYASESEDSAPFSVFDTQSYLPKTFTDSDTGVWMYATAAPVPEPEIYAMMGLGLGLLGWVGRRRKLQAA